MVSLSRNERKWQNDYCQIQPENLFGNEISPKKRNHRTTIERIHIMNALSVFDRKWRPFKEMEELQNRLNTYFGNSSLTRNSDQESAAPAKWAPLVDIVEDEKEYLIKAELPEINKEDISIKVDKGVLSITGERKFEKEEKGKKYHRVERSYGHFTRTFTLPEDADADNVKAEFKNGVLEVHLHKAEKAKPKQIDINVG
jgi:HSP20 family protein